MPETEIPPFTDGLFLFVILCHKTDLICLAFETKSLSEYFQSYKIKVIHHIIISYNAGVYPMRLRHRVIISICITIIRVYAHECVF